jgi:hypothetical protein
MEKVQLHICVALLPMKAQPVSCAKKDGVPAEPYGCGGYEKKISDPSGNQIPIIQIPQYMHSTGKFKKHFMECYMGF